MTARSVEEEYLAIAEKNAWPLVYQKIAQECTVYELTYEEARKPNNKALNRYRDVNPYDHSRVILKRSECDYINANVVTMKRANRSYILTQGPLPFTVNHFWLMVWEQKSRAILMLNKLIEKSEVKCHWYWPRGNGETHKLELPEVGLSVEQIREEDFNYYSMRLFHITDIASAVSREVVQFHYTTWPDFGVPSSPVAFLEFLRKVRQSGALDPEVGPAIVHCSAGIGRSGTFCLVDSCLVIIEKEGPCSVNVQQVLVEMRKDRMGLIQTSDQLKFSYQAIIEGAKRFDPNWREDHRMGESLYSAVAEEGEEAPPPPPPRGESLSRAPARPLPAIPSSTSLGCLNIPVIRDSSSDESSPTAPVRESSSADDEDDEPLFGHGDSGGGEAAGSLRQRRTRELAERVSSMKKRARNNERWRSFKRLKQETQTYTEPREDSGKNW